MKLKVIIALFCEKCDKPLTMLGDDEHIVCEGCGDQVDTQTLTDLGLNEKAAKIMATVVFAGISEKDVAVGVLEAFL